MTPEAESRIAHLRREATSRDLTLEEMREVIALLRAGRVSAHHASDTARKAKAKAEIPDANSLLDLL
jgi:hypothetical protein